MHPIISSSRPFAFNTLDPDIVKEMLPYVDGIAIQPPFHGQFPKEKFDEIHKLTQKPILICDFAIRFKDGEKDIRSWKPAADSVAAGKAYAESFKPPSKPITWSGVFWCNPVDTPKGFGKPGVKQGFFRKSLVGRAGLHQSVKGSQFPSGSPDAKELDYPLPSLLSKKS